MLYLETFYLMPARMPDFIYKDGTFLVKFWFKEKRVSWMTEKSLKLIIKRNNIHYAKRSLKSQHLPKYMLTKILKEYKKWQIDNQIKRLLTEEN